MFSKKQADIAVKEKKYKSDFSFNRFFVFSGSPWGRTGSGNQPHRFNGFALREGNITCFMFSRVREDSRAGRLLF
jgi:hypothetical protein